MIQEEPTQLPCARLRDSMVSVLLCTGKVSNAGRTWVAENVSKVEYVWPVIMAYGMVVTLFRTIQPNSLQDDLLSQRIHSSVTHRFGGGT